MAGHNCEPELLQLGNMLFEPFSHRSLSLQNRIVMAPMTRCRATLNNTPNAMMAKYYAQRASAGLIITEGTSPSPNGLGYARMPGIFAAPHVSGWRTVTDAVHRAGSKIFIQLMHAGRVAAQENLPDGAEVLSPTDVVCPGKMFTDTAGMQPHAAPRAMDEAAIAATIAEFATAAELAIEAGFDGVELHGANGYLIEQFLNANINTRNDTWGGSAAARNRFAIEVAKACIAKVGADKVAMRISPYGVFNGTGPFAGIDEQYVALARDLAALDLIYLHVVDHSAMGAPAVPDTIKHQLREAFPGLLMLVGGYTRERAEADLASHHADLIAFGRAFISNPDLVERLAQNATLATADHTTFYSPSGKGYIDYPTLGQS